MDDLILPSMDILRGLLDGIILSVAPVTLVLRHNTSGLKWITLHPTRLMLVRLPFILYCPTYYLS